MTRPKPLREHRYYKRVTRWRTTRCWGVAVAVGLLLPAGPLVAANQATNVPAPFPSPTPPPAPAPESRPAQTPAPAAASYASAWTVPFSGDGPLTLTFTSSSLILSGSEIPTEARALDDGHTLWTSKREANAAPAIAGNLVIVPSDGQLVALDAATGHDVWTAEYSGVAQPPAVAEDTVLTAAGTTLVARRAADGTPIWSADLGASAIAPPAVGDAVIVVALDNRQLSAFDRGTGRPIWRHPNNVTPLALTVLGDRVYLSAAEGYACAHKLEHGRQDWCFPVRVRPIGAPVGDAKQMYFAFLDNTVHVFDRRSGRRYLTPSLDALPAGGPTLTADHLIVPVVTGEFVLLSVREGFQSSRVSTPRAVELPSTRASAVRGDGSAMAIVTTSAGARYSLVYFSRKPPEEAKKAEEPKKDSEPERSDGTVSDKPPAPKAP